LAHNCSLHRSVILVGIVQVSSLNCKSLLLEE
jgi:hypothetical protein